MPSTPFKDLVDLVAMITEASVAADRQLAALRFEAERRGILLPPRFDVPAGGQLKCPRTGRNCLALTDDTLSSFGA